MSWSDLDYTRPRPRLLARGVPERLVPPAEPPLAEWERLAGEIIDARAGRPDLVRESEQRSALAHQARLAAFRGSTAPADVNVAREGSATTWWPDPYGPDLTVFGPPPHKNPFSD